MNWLAVLVIVLLLATIMAMPGFGWHSLGWGPSAILFFLFGVASGLYLFRVGRRDEV